MKVIFAGYGELGMAVLEPLLQRHEVVAVLTHPEGFTGLEGSHVQNLGQRSGVPVFLASTGRENGLADTLSDLSADVLVSTNWRTRMPPELLKVSQAGAVNVHDALLPSYAGFGAVNWAIRDGQDHTGLTVHFMSEELDAGPVILQTRLDIGDSEDATSVTERLTAQYGDALLKALQLVGDGYQGNEQDMSQAWFGHRITVQDTQIDWTWPTRHIVNLVRAQSVPFVNAWCLYQGERLFATCAVAPQRAVRGAPGRIVANAEDGVIVGCGEPGNPQARGVVLTQVRPDGGDPIGAADFFGPVRGARYLT